MKFGENNNVNTNKRRFFLKSGLLGLTALSSLALFPKVVFAKWSREAFKAKSIPKVLTTLLGTSEMEASSRINIKAPDIAENGAVVPVTISTDLEASSITILAPNNPSPLIGNFILSPEAVPYVATRIKMGKTGDIVAIVKVGDKLYTTKKTVKVTIGGCGG